MSSDAWENQKWISRLQGGEATRDKAIQELGRILVRGLSKSLANRSGGGLQPEDVAQEALTIILDSHDAFEDRSSFTTRAMTIATRLGIREPRRKRYSDVSLKTLGSETKTSLGASDSEHANIETGWSKQKIMNQLNLFIKSSLTDRQRRVIRV